MRRTLALALLGALVLSLAACTTETKDTGFPTAAPSPTGSETHGGGEPTDGPLTGPIDVADPIDFKPRLATVKVGTEVVWHQSGVIPHTVTSAEEGLFDSSPGCPEDQTKCMHEGDEFKYTFEEAGKYVYYCKLHGSGSGPEGSGMAGVITVEA